MVMNRRLDECVWSQKKKERELPQGRGKDALLRREREEEE